jgi:2'-5' RNA ligase
VVGLRPWLRELTPYRPHVTVAYCRPGTDLPADRLRPVLDSLRRLPPVRLRVRRVSLVRVAPGGGRGEWHTVSSVPLGARIVP